MDAVRVTTTSGRGGRAGSGGRRVEDRDQLLFLVGQMAFELVGEPLDFAQYQQGIRAIGGDW